MEKHYTDYKGREFPGTFTVPDYDDDGYPHTRIDVPDFPDHYDAEFPDSDWDDLCWNPPAGIPFDRL